jgi:hypothetical protein
MINPFQKIRSLIVTAANYKSRRIKIKGQIKKSAPLKSGGAF